MTAPRRPLAGTWGDRFDANVIPEPMSGCHIWVAGVNQDGYGSIRCDGIRKRAHRVAWERVHGEVPDGLWVLHRCDNPSCVNPSHLFLGTAKDNAVDMARKGRCNNVRSAPEDRFRRFIRLDRATGCIIWTGARFRDGSGRFKVWPKSLSASRFAWERTHGLIPVGQCVRHRCDVKECVNPAHLFLASRASLFAGREGK